MVQFKWDKGIIKKYVEPVVFVILWVQVTLNMMRVNMNEFSVPRDMHFYRAMAFLLVILIIARKVKVLNVPVILFSVVSISYVFYYLHKHNGDWGITYRDALFGKYISLCFCGIIVIDLIRRRNINLRSFNLKPCICAIVVFAIMAIKDFNAVWAFELICLVIFFAVIDEEMWLLQMKCLAVGGYFSFAFLFYKSFTQNPDNYIDGRYVGNFYFPVAAGLAASFGLICALYLLTGELRKEKKNRIIVALLALALIPPLVMEVLVMNRASIAGLLLLLVLSFIFFMGKTDKKSVIIKSIVTVAVIVCISAIGLLSMKAASKIDAKAFQEKYEDNKLMLPARYFVRKSDYSFNSGDEWSMFEPGTMLNAIDNFSSSRLTLWTRGIQTAGLMPVEDVGVYYPSGAYMPHAHNQYICLIRKYGYLGGIPIIVAHFIIFAAAIKGCKKDKSRYLLTYMWLAYSLGLFIFEYKTCGMMPYCIFPILFLPILHKGQSNT